MTMTEKYTHEQIDKAVRGEEGRLVGTGDRDASEGMGGLSSPRSGPTADLDPDGPHAQALARSFGSS